MDAMALLCTLHADGPTTLKRLRQAGCDSIEAVGGLDPDRLAELLGTTPAAARRFLREAAHLCARLDTGFLEREEKGVEVPGTDLSVGRDLGLKAPAAIDSGAKHLAAKRPAAESSSASTAPAQAKPTSLGYRDQRIVEQVLQAWRKQDSEEGTPAGAADDGSAEAARAVHPEEGRAAAERAARSTSGRETTDEHAAGAMPPEPTNVPATEIVPGAVDGLDQETCLRLRRAGIHDIEMLAGIDALALSTTLGVGYMRLARLCALARRRLARAPAPSAREPRAPRSPATFAPAVPSDPGANASSEIKFSRAGHPLIGVLPALAQDLEIHVGPKPVLPRKTRWSPAPAATGDADAAGGPFA